MIAVKIKTRNWTDSVRATLAFFVVRGTLTLTLLLGFSNNVAFATWTEFTWPDGAKQFTNDRPDRKIKYIRFDAGDYDFALTPSDYAILDVEVGMNDAKSRISLKNHLVKNGIKAEWIEFGDFSIHNSTTHSIYVKWPFRDGNKIGTPDRLIRILHEFEPLHNKKSSVNNPGVETYYAMVRALQSKINAAMEMSARKNTPNGFGTGSNWTNNNDSAGDSPKLNNITGCKRRASEFANDDSDDSSHSNRNHWGSAGAGSASKKY